MKESRYAEKYVQEKKNQKIRQYKKIQKKMIVITVIIRIQYKKDR